MLGGYGLWHVMCDCSHADGSSLHWDAEYSMMEIIIFATLLLNRQTVMSQLRITLKQHQT